MGVYVLGMHRSGTSAVTRVVNLLGVPIGREDRLMPVQADNPGGFWEHLALMDVNDAVLAALGGTWDAPPEPPRDFAARGDLADLEERARTEFRATYDGDRWVFKDPRASVLLPFWRRVIGAGHPSSVADVALIVVRNPLDIAASIARRNHLAVSYTLAVWERYTRLIRRDTHRMPVFVVDYDALLDAPQRVNAIEEFLRAHDQIADVSDRSAAQGSLTGSLRHGRHDRAALDRDPRVTPEQRALYDASVRELGAHESFDPGPLPDPSPSTALLIAARQAPKSLEAVTLAAVLAQLGEAEGQLDDVRAEADRNQAVRDAVEDTLGYTDLGKLERAALGAARRARGVQQRLTRP
jgi:hypothetical protein